MHIKGGPYMTIRFEPHGAAKGFYAAFGHKDALLVRERPRGQTGRRNADPHDCDYDDEKNQYAAD